MKLNDLARQAQDNPAKKGAFRTGTDQRVGLGCIVGGVARLPAA